MLYSLPATDAKFAPDAFVVAQTLPAGTLSSANATNLHTPTPSPQTGFYGSNPPAGSQGSADRGLTASPAAMISGNELKPTDALGSLLPDWRVRVDDHSDVFVGGPVDPGDPGSPIDQSRSDMLPPSPFFPVYRAEPDVSSPWTRVAPPRDAVAAPLTGTSSQNAVTSSFVATRLGRVETGADDTPAPRSATMTPVFVQMEAEEVAAPAPAPADLIESVPVPQSVDPLGSAPAAGDSGPSGTFFGTFEIPVPFAGTVPVDLSAVGAGAKEFLNRLADLGKDVPGGDEQVESYVWAVAAVLLTSGVAHAVRTDRSRARAAATVPEADSVLARWGLANDGRPS
ncbi:hypothetical protein [Fimbriiglobus ruber]|nr:hypothetical protein [Fimbriiglobus ruber]